MGRIAVLCGRTKMRKLDICWLSTSKYAALTPPLAHGHTARKLLEACFVFVLLLAAMPVFAQSGSRGDGHAEHHDWYNGLTRPDVGGSCCHGATAAREGDCRPVRAWLHDDGVWRAVVDRRLVAIPPEKIIMRSAPDGGSHLCMSDLGFIYCFVPGQPKS